MPASLDWISFQVQKPSRFVGRRSHLDVRRDWPISGQACSSGSFRSILAHDDACEVVFNRLGDFAAVTGH